MIQWLLGVWQWIVWTVTQLIVWIPYRRVVGWSALISLLSILPVMGVMYRRLKRQAKSDASAFSETIKALEAKVDYVSVRQQIVIARQEATEKAITDQWASIALEMGNLRSDVMNVQRAMDNLARAVQPMLPSPPASGAIN